MNSNIFNTSENSFVPNNSNSTSSIITYNYKEKDDENDKNELKNLRIENSLSLRKKKLNELILLKRKKEINVQNDDEYDIYVDYQKIINNIPKLIVEEFDMYEDKLSLIHQFLNKDFTLLHGMNFDEKDLRQFAIYKLTCLSFSENTIIYEEQFEKDLKIIFYDLIKLINESNDKKLIFGISTIIVNFVYSSGNLAQEFKKVNIWKRLAEITDLKIPDINDNIVTILSNYYSFDKKAGKEYILSNYSRYIKQILTNFFKTFIDESKKENIDLNLYLSGINLIAKLINNENSEVNKKNELDVVVKMKFIYDYISKAFSIASSWILNNVNLPKHEHIFRFISTLMKLLSMIATYIQEETYQMQEFRGEAFVSSFCSLIKFLITNKEKRVSFEYILSVLEDLYNFIGIFFSIKQENTDIYTINKIIIITEEFVKNINIMKESLVNKIIFFLSNYVDNENKSKEIFEESSIFLIIKDYIYSIIIDNRLCYNFYILIENGFKVGGNKSKLIIIENCSKFLIERIKLLYELIVSKGKEDKNKIKFLLEKCELLLYFVRFLRNSPENKLQLLKDLLDYIKISNLEEFVENIQTFVEIKEDQERIERIIKELKNIIT